MLSLRLFLGKPYTIPFSIHLISTHHKCTHHCYNYCSDQEQVPSEEVCYDEFDEF
jgi:hypothetical protein